MRQLLNLLPWPRRAPLFLLPTFCTHTHISPQIQNQWQKKADEQGQNQHEQEQEEEEEESISITNLSHWTQKIDSLCTIQSNVDAALSLLDRLHLRGYCPTSRDLASIVLALCRARRFSEAHHRLLLSPFLPDHTTSNVLLSNLLQGQTPKLTSRVLSRIISADPSFTPSLSVYNRLIHQFGSIFEPNEAHTLFIHLLKRGLSPNVVTYTSLIDGYCRCGNLESAHQLFEEMRMKGVMPNPLTYTVLIKGRLEKRDIEGGMRLIDELWQRMPCEEDSSVNSAAFANLIDTLCRTKLFQEVFKIAEEMPQGKCVCLKFAFGQMIDSLCGARRNHGASRIVYIMRKRGVVPSLVSYNSIIHGLSKEGEGGCMRAYQLFEEGVAFGYFPQEPTFKTLTEALCRVHDLGKAKYLVDFMLQPEGANKTRIYNIYLSALCLVDNPSELLNVLVAMLQNECQPDVVTLNTVIHGLCKTGRIDEAMKILHDMVNGNFCGPDVVTFTTMINGLLSVGRTEEALKLLQQKMPKSCCKPSVVTYNAVLHGLCKSRKVDEAMEILNSMVAEGIRADSTTYTILIDGFCGSNRIDEAKRFWEDVVWPSRVHDDFVYAAIVRGLCNAGKLNEAHDFLYELVDCGVSAKIVNYNILIDKACSMGLKRDAYQILEEMRRNCWLEPDAVTWRTLDKLHTNSRKSTVVEKNLESEGVLKLQKDNTQLKEHEMGCVILEEEENGLKEKMGHEPLEGIVELPSLHSDKENGLNDDMDEGPLRGLMDPILAAEQGEEDGDGCYNLAGNNLGRLLSEKKEPLSKIARRVFGLL